MFIVISISAWSTLLWPQCCLKFRSHYLHRLKSTSVCVGVIIVVPAGSAQSLITAGTQLQA